MFYVFLWKYKGSPDNKISCLDLCEIKLGMGQRGRFFDTSIIQRKYKSPSKETTRTGEHARLNIPGEGLPWKHTDALRSDYLNIPGEGLPWKHTDALRSDYLQPQTVSTAFIYLLGQPPFFLSNQKLK